MNLSIIVGFLQAALSVLLLVHNTPDATPEMIQQALSTANQAVQMAQAGIANQSLGGGDTTSPIGPGTPPAPAEVGGPSLPESDISVVSTGGVDFPNAYRLQA